MIILINPFTVFAGHERAFLALWDQTGEAFRASPGYLSARLCQAMDAQPAGLVAPYTHVNVAEWETAEDYAHALQQPIIRRLGPAYRQVCTFDPALYHVIREQSPA